jgi:galactokinase
VSAAADFIGERLAELGMNAADAGAKRELADAAVPMIGNPEFALFVPGRVEICGKHTDYAGGRSVVCAAERGIILIGRKRADNLIRITRTDSRESCEFALGPELHPDDGHWSNYAATVARRVSRNFPGARTGMEIAIASDLPQAAGLSSSSAIVVAMFMALAHVNRLRERQEYRENIRCTEDLAGYLGTVENGQNFSTLAGDKGVGTFGGSQDHTAILCGRRAELSTYSYCPVRSEGRAPFPSSQALMIGVSGVIAEKTRAARDHYNRVSLRVSEIMRRWREATGRTDATLAAAVRSAPDAPDRLRHVVRDAKEQRGYSSQELLDRLNQFVEESEQIIPQVCDALRRNDLARLGELADRSQELAETKLANQIPETVGLAASARLLGATASSAFGAGFGGSVWAMIAENESDAFIRAWRERYHREFSDAASRAQFFITRPGLPATQIELPES